MRIIDGGVERIVDAGRIDITAEDRDGALVVIELKAGRADLPAVGQVLSYMGTAAPGEDRPVRGMLVAGDFDERAEMARARRAPPDSADLLLPVRVRRAVSLGDDEEGPP